MALNKSQAHHAHAALEDMITAAFELAIARFVLADGVARAEVAALPASTTVLDHGQSGLVDRIAFVIPRVAARLPWRADCLVQALAAKRWLGRRGIKSTLTLGVAKDPQSTFEAHAWLTAGDRIVTGGDISGYVPLSRP